MPTPSRKLVSHISTVISPPRIKPLSFRQDQMVLKHIHKMSASSSSPLPPKKHINLIRGWPSPSLLPNQSLLASAQVALTDPSAFIPGLQYGPDPGYLPLREEISRWLSPYYKVTPDVERICITGGASQNIACILQSFTDPGYTRAVWMVAPCYFLAGPIFEDGGFYGKNGRLRGFGEDAEGPHVEGESEERG
jgi:DNA-binding transcriptional MocR family regulator